MNVNIDLSSFHLQVVEFNFSSMRLARTWPQIAHSHAVSVFMIHLATIQAAIVSLETKLLYEDTVNTSAFKMI